MALKRLALQLGTGTDIRGGDYTKAAIRAVKAALWQNVLSVAKAFDMPNEAMVVEIIIGVEKPDQVDKVAVGAVLPYGTADVRVEHGGMDTPFDDSNDITVLANAAVVVYLDLPDDKVWGDAA